MLVSPVNLSSLKCGNLKAVPEFLLGGGEEGKQRIKSAVAPLLPSFQHLPGMLGLEGGGCRGRNG